MALKTRLMIAAGIALAAAGTAAAHHSFAMFDEKKELALTATVVEFRWKNPHTHIIMEVAKDNPALAGTWDIEGASIAIMSRQGWTKSSFKPGEKIDVVVHPLRDGEKGGSLIYAIDKNGDRLYHDTARAGGEYADGAEQPAAAPASSPTPARPVADNRVRGLSGYWRLKDKDSAEQPLTPWAKTEKAKSDRKGDVDLASDLWCIFQGMPYVMDNAGPIEIRQSAAETVILSERLAIPRHIYFQLDKRPSPDVFDFTPVGFSMGRREGSALLVETDMFSNGVGLEGAPRTEKAKLVEKFEVSGDGKQLTITSTWTDPDVFTSPYVYTRTYEKAPEDYTVSFYYCDPRANGVGNYPPGEAPPARKSSN